MITQELFFLKLSSMFVVWNQTVSSTKDGLGPHTLVFVFSFKFFFLQYIFWTLRCYFWNLFLMDWYFLYFNRTNLKGSSANCPWAPKLLHSPQVVGARHEVKHVPFRLYLRLNVKSLLIVFFTSSGRCTIRHKILQCVTSFTQISWTLGIVIVIKLWSYF